MNLCSSTMHNAVYKWLQTADIWTSCSIYH